MTPTQLQNYLNRLIKHKLPISTMIWGPPGIGKSSIVEQVSRRHKLDFVDVRLSQLAPTDLRGLPVAENGVSKWYPPEFLPQKGQGILFLDELNMAPPAMQGMAQQLILDRRVGSYEVPPGWYIWAAGNRKEDRAAVFDMPSPLANRFLHLEVQPDFDSFKTYAMTKKIHEQIIAFLSFRTPLLHQPNYQQPAWPSPRSWEMASKLHKAGLEIDPAVGYETTAEFKAFLDLYENLPDLSLIFQGQATHISFPSEPSVRYALTVALAVRAHDDVEGYNAFLWLSELASSEWVQLFALDLFRQMRSKGKMGLLAQLVQKDEKLQQFLKEFQGLLVG